MILSDNTPPPLSRGPRVSYTLRDRNPGDAAQPNPTVSGVMSSTGGPEKLGLHSREKQRLQRRGHDRPRRPSSHIHVRAYYRPSWFSALGVRAKRKRIEAKGLPNFHNWRFITLTIDQTLFYSPLAAYLAASDHMRRFLYACRKAGLWKNDAKWCWKLEFQRNGWPHWHLLVEKRSKIDYVKLRELWGLGHTDVERVNEKGFRYNFKYAFKATEVDGEDGQFQGAPDWFLDYMGQKTVAVPLADGSTVDAEKPVTFARVRFWQTSRGFYTGSKRPAPDRKEQSTWTVPRTVRQILDDHGSTVQVVARHGSGVYQGSMTIRIGHSLEHFWNLVGFDTIHAGAVGLGVKSFVIPTHRITTDPKTSWQLKPLLRKNTLTLRHARILQDRGETLRTC
jgi:hypothetical protein